LVQMDFWQSAKMDAENGGHSSRLAEFQPVGPNRRLACFYRSGGETASRNVEEQAEITGALGLEPYGSPKSMIVDQRQSWICATFADTGKRLRALFWSSHSRSRVRCLTNWEKTRARWPLRIRLSTISPKAHSLAPGRILEPAGTPTPALGEGRGGFVPLCSCVLQRLGLVEDQGDPPWRT
jgi:hypothetical protein